MKLVAAFANEDRFSDVVFNESIDGSKDVLVARHIVKSIWTVLLHPAFASTMYRVK